MKQHAPTPPARSARSSKRGTAPPDVEQPMGNQAALAELEAAKDADEGESVLHKLGEGFGLGAGFLVTELLALVPGWNDDLMNEDGTPVQAVEGAQREGDYNLEGRHKQVVGPQIADYASGLDSGWWKDFLTGVGEGATDAPGASYRFEAAVVDHFDGD